MCAVKCVYCCVRLTISRAVLSGIIELFIAVVVLYIYVSYANIRELCACKLVYIRLCNQRRSLTLTKDCVLS